MNRVFKVIDVRFPKIHNVRFVENKPYRVVFADFISIKDALELKAYFPNIRSLVADYKLYVAVGGYNVVLPSQDKNGLIWNFHVLLGKIFSKESAVSSNGGNCNKCGLYNEYQNGFYICYSCANKA